MQALHKEPQRIIEAIFIRVLSRRPTSTEMQAMLDLVANNKAPAIYEDIFAGLFTTSDYDIPTTITVGEDSGAYSQAGFATAPSTGPSNESSQIISYTITGASTNLFSVAPAISADGTLYFASEIKSLLAAGAVSAGGL